MREGKKINNNFLFLGGRFPKSYETEIFSESRGPIQFAANNFQNKIIEGIEENLNSKIIKLNAIFVGSYPKFYKKFYLNGKKWKITNEEHFISFVNIFGIKHIYRFFAIFSYMNNWFLNEKDAKKNVVIYSLHTPFILSSYIMKLLYPNSHFCLICPDLPEYMNIGSEMRLFPRLLKKMDTWLLKKLIKKMDSLVILTKYMIDKLIISEEAKYMVIEGIIDNGIYRINQHLKIEKATRVLLYTGTLNKEYGIVDLLNAFDNSKCDKMELWICGDGNSRKNVLDFAAKNHRIKYLGQLPKNTIDQLQREATVLINPRKPTEDFTRYSFPSKVLEYFSSGTPTLMYKLEGIPDEYDEYYFKIEDGECGLAKSIEMIQSIDYVFLLEKGEKAQSFVLDRKTPLVQAKKILDLMGVEI